MKLNNKGFMMAEVIVTCSIVVITLVGLFTSYNKTYLRYKERSNYYNVDNAYACNYLKDLLIENNILYNNTASYYYIDNTINDKISVLLNNYNITNVPCILVFKDAKLVDIYSIKDNDYNTDNVLNYIIDNEMSIE